LDPHIGLVARLLEAVRTVPIWLFFAIAASLSVLVVFPGFQAALSFSGPFTQFATIAAWIFFAARVVEPITSAVVTYIQFRRDARYYVFTPNPFQCFWSISPQRDGTQVAQLSLRCMVKNRSAEPLHLTRARVVRPRVSNWTTVLVLPAGGSTFGTLQVSGVRVGPGAAAPLACTFIIDGVVRRGTRPMKATFEFEDAEATRVRVRAELERQGATEDPA
jgi:hypothetical protein